MITIVPVEYKSFKRRITPILLISLLFPVIMPIVALKYYNANTYNIQFNIELGAGLSLFVILLGLRYAVFSLDSITIDTSRKKLSVYIRKFDTIIDKGEYNIDDDLNAEIIKKTTKGKDYYRLQLKYKDAIIFPRYVTADGWNKEMFANVCDEIEKIKKTNSSVPRLD